MKASLKSTVLKWFHRIFRICLWTVACVAILMLICMAIFRHEGIKKAALEHLTVGLEQQTGWRLEMQEVGGFLPFHLTSHHVVLTQGTQPLIQAEKLELALSPFELLRGRIAFAFIDLENVHISFPSSKADTKISAEDIHKNIPLFPMALEIEKFRFKNVTTTPEILSVPCDLTGSIEINPSLGSLFGEVGFSCSQNSTLPTILSFEVFQSSTALNKLMGTFEVHGYALPLFPVTMQGKISLTNEGVIQLETIEVNLEHTGETPTLFATAQGHLTLTPDFNIIDSHFDLSIPDLTVLQPFSIPSSGKIIAECQLKGSAFSPTLETLIHGENTILGTHDIQNLSSKLTLSFPNNEVKGHWNLMGKIDQFPFTFNTHLSWKFPQELSFPTVDLTLPSTTLQGHLGFSFANHMWTGELNGQAQDLSLFSSFVPSTVNGQVAIQTILSFEIPKSVEGDYEKPPIQKLDISLTGSQLRYEDWELESISIKSGLYDPFKQPLGELTLNIRNATQKGVMWKELTWQTKVDKQLSAWPFTFSASGSIPNEINVKSSGSWRATTHAFDLHLEELNGMIAQHPITLQQPTDIRLENDLIEILPTKMNIGPGTLDLAAGIADGIVHANIMGEQIPLEAIPSSQLAEFVSSGLISLDASLTGSLKEPTGQIKAHVQNITLKKEKWMQVPPFEGYLEGDLKPSELAITGQLNGIGEQPIAINAQLPINLSFSPFHASPDPDGKLALHAQAEGEIASLFSLLTTNDTVSITGYGKAAFDVNGTWKKPEVTGRAEITRGTFEDLDTGAVFEQISLVFEGNQREIILKHFSGVDGRIGTVTGNGTIQLDPEAGFPFTCKFHMDNCIMIHLDYALASASGDITYSGNVDQVTVDGDLTLDKAKLTIPEEMPSQMKAVEITYINLPTLTPAPYQLKKKQDRHPFHLNIALHVPKKAYVKGRDLKSEWQGDIQFSGTTTHPLVDGSLNIMNGEYLFNGRSFTSNKGTITFAGDPAKSTLYVIAEQQIDDNKVEIILKGPLGDPIVSFRSNPPMSQREILSWILFNRGISDITPLQGAELSQTVFTVSGGKDSPDLLTKLRQSVGIDRVDISSRDTEDSNEVSLRVGKYISKGVFVSVNKSINADANQVAIEAKLYRHFKVQAEVGDDAQGKMSLKWEKDY